MITSFTIKHTKVSGDDGLSREDWNVFSEGYAWDGLAWDEMLGIVSRLAMSREVPHRTCEREVETGLRYEDMMPPLQVVRVGENRDGGIFTIASGHRFIDELTYDETLGFLAAYTLTGKEMFSGFMTTEQWRRRRMRVKAVTTCR